jgi:hypothetical protein
MERIKRERTAPATVSLSKNNCTYPLIFPPTKKIEEHRLTNGVEVRGIADLNEEGEINYVIGFGNISLNGKKLTSLNKIDGQVLMGILAYFQMKIRKLKKDDKFRDRDIDYRLTFKSMYELLTFLKMPTNSPRYYERVKEALHKIMNTTLYFCKGYYSVEEGCTLSSSATINILSSLKINEAGASRKDCSIEIAICRDWYAMHEAYFVLAEIDLYKKLSEAQINLRNLLEAFRPKMLEDSISITRNLKKLATKIGYGDSPLYKYRETITEAIKAINREERKGYKVRFKGDNIIFSV